MKKKLFVVMDVLCVLVGKFYAQNVETKRFFPSSERMRFIAFSTQFLYQLVSDPLERIEPKTKTS